MGLRAGRLRQRITIRRQEDVSDGKGGFTRGWTTVAANLAAEVVSQGGRESLIAGTLQGISTYKITVRQRGDLRASDQILYRPPKADADLELNIRSFNVDPFEPQATVIFADSEAPQGAGD